MQIPVNIKPTYLLQTEDVSKLYLQYVWLHYISLSMDYETNKDAKLGKLFLSPAILIKNLVARNFTENYRYEEIEIKDTKIRLSLNCEDYNIGSFVGVTVLASYDLEKLLYFISGVYKAEKLHRFLDTLKMQDVYDSGDENQNCFHTTMDMAMNIGFDFLQASLEDIKDRLVSFGSFYDSELDIVLVLRGDDEERAEKAID